MSGGGSSLASEANGEDGWQTTRRHRPTTAPLTTRSVLTTAARTVPTFCCATLSTNLVKVASLHPGSRVSGFRFWVSGFGFRVPGFGCWISDLGFQVSGFGFRVSGFGFRVLDFGFRVSGFGFRGSMSGLRGRSRVGADIFVLPSAHQGNPRPQTPNPKL